jgi:transposase
VAQLKQVKGVGTLIALTFLLTLEDAHRFHKSRDVGCYLGLQPGRRNSGQSEPQMHISKEGDPVNGKRISHGQRTAERPRRCGTRASQT